jgi:hypothetical protein
VTVAEDILRALRDGAAGMTDSELAGLLGKGHTHINRACHGLADQGLTIRDSSHGQIINRLAGAAPPAPEAPVPAEHPDHDWAWEGNVQSRFVTRLAATGWLITRVADTARRERGVDIVAQRDGQQLLVEVKGWPSTTYARGEMAGRPKPTQPTLQAAHWFAEVLMSLIRRGAKPGQTLAMGLPDMPRYRTLLGEAGWALERLDITIYLVTPDGTVREWEREN